MDTRIQRWGNSLAVRIPKSFAVEIGLSEDAPVDLRMSDGSLVITPARRVRGTLNLEDLVAAMPADIRPEELDWGPPAGSEVW